MQAKHQVQVLIGDERSGELNQEAHKCRSCITAYKQVENCSARHE